MRHLFASAVTWALAVGLVLGAGLFAWARSAQLIIATEADVEPARFSPAAGVPPASMAAFAWREFGEATYLRNCQNCHTADGSGRGMYPPIQNQAAHLRADGGPGDGGRGYLIDLVLYGLHTGEYGAPMPPMPELSDAEIAAVTNYLLTRFAAPRSSKNGGAPAPSRLFLPSDVAARRGRNLSERDVAGSRPPVPSAEALGRGVRPPLDADAPAVPEGTDR